jgi:hypothetical protein
METGEDRTRGAWTELFDVANTKFLQEGKQWKIACILTASCVHFLEARPANSVGAIEVANLSHPVHRLNTAELIMHAANAFPGTPGPDTRVCGARPCHSG